MKPYAKNPSKSNEDFLNDLIRPYIDAARIKGPDDTEFHLDKSRTSKLLAGKLEVPEKLREALERYGLEDAVAHNFELFVEEILEDSHLDEMKKNIFTFFAGDEAMDCAYLMEANDNTPSFLARALLIAIRNPNVKSQVGALWSRGAASISWKTGDLFKFGFENRRSRQNIVVIPVNTRFDTHVTTKQEGSIAPLVSYHTLHGQWISRMLACGINEQDLNKRIHADLTARSSFEDASGRYPIGTIAAIEHKASTYYLLAIADFNENNNAHSDANDIKAAATSLAKFYDCNGQGTDIYIPLLGTGMSRAGLDYKRLFDLIVDTFINGGSCFTGKVTIVITSEAAQELGLGK